MVGELVGTPGVLIRDRVRKGTNRVPCDGGLKNPLGH